MRYFSDGVRAIVLCCRSAPRQVSMFFLISVGTAMLPVVVAWLTKIVLDRLTSEAPLQNLIPLIAGLVSAGLVGSTAPMLAEYLRSEINRRVELCAKDELFTTVDRFAGLERFENPDFLDQLRLAQESINLPGQTVDGATGIIRGAIILIGFSASLWTLSPLISGLVIAAAIPTLLVELRLSRRRASMAWDLGPTERREFFYTNLLSSVEAAKEIRLFQLGPFLRGRMIAEKRSSNNARRKIDRQELLAQSGLAVLAAGVTGAGLVWTISAAVRREITLGDVAMFVAAVAGVQGALASLVGSIAVVHQQLLMFRHYVDVMHAEPDLPSQEKASNLPALRKGIRFSDVWFRYSADHDWVLRGVSLFIPFGETIAIVGGNGAGKSTLVKLLCRFYDPTQGSIQWDGVDLREIPIARLRERIGAVFQDFMTYDFNAADNIAVGDLSALDDRDRIEAAAERAGIHETVVSLPNSYETLLTRMFFNEAENASTGVILSGGQWQRIALARSFLRDERDLMILDEPSSGLDPEREHELHIRLQQIRKGRTSVLITHRLGAIRDDDLVVVLEDGVVVEQGCHTTLRLAGGTYSRLFDLQASGYVREPS